MTTKHQSKIFKARLFNRLVKAFKANKVIQVNSLDNPRNCGWITLFRHKYDGTQESVDNFIRYLNSPPDMQYRIKHHLKRVL